MSRSWKIAVSQQRQRAGGAKKGTGPGDAAPQEEEPFAELPCCPLRLCLPTSGPNWEGADRG